ncbi:hypothetical protein P20495_2727 [Pseudoalteromonas sp. BSi20495]|nr:hypothetical protein P20495_2727 [Pseudoalteromonas sp. BSi20495]
MQVDTLFYCDALKCRLGRVELWWLNLHQYVWFLGKAEPMKCGYSP